VIDARRPREVAPHVTADRRRSLPGWRSPYLWIAALIVLIDQLTKAAVRAWLPLHESIEVIPGLLNLTHVRNTGAAFGLLNAVDFPGKPAAVALAATVALVIIAVYAARLAPHQQVARLGLTLIIAGAVGNLIDRVAVGSVVDFVDVYWRSYHFWAFNVADAAITTGVLVVILDMLRTGSNVSTTP
jgi:signal peptidase II